MNDRNDFRKYAVRHLGMDGLTVDEVMKAQAQYLNPYILEERQLNVTQMDVFSRLMMDRIIFLGTQIDDYTANTLQAQLLYLDSVDSGKDISIYINSPGGSVTAGLGIYDTMQFISSDVATICTGMAASMGAVLLVAGKEGKRSALPHSRVMIHQPLGGVQGQASDAAARRAGAAGRRALRAEPDVSLHPAGQVAGLRQHRRAGRGLVAGIRHADAGASGERDVERREHPAAERCGEIRTSFRLYH